jgi:hypothetical protein
MLLEGAKGFGPSTPTLASSYMGNFPTLANSRSASYLFLCTLNSSKLRRKILGAEAMNSKDSAPVKPAGPTAPQLTSRDLLRQFWADAYGKEVQTAATYSYTWLADQFGHICIGLVVDFPATVVSGLVMVQLGWAPKFEYDTGIWPGLIFTIAVVAYWEWRAYQSSVKQATGAFPLDSKLLRDNAIIAATYMTLGAILGFAFHLPLKPAILISAGVVVAAIVLAPRWLRQKIIWQKASMPYLFRLADAAPNIGSEDAKTLQNLIDAGAPPVTEPCQIIIGGPIGSGRTSMAAGIGTEFAFKQNKVRYLGLDCLLEFATNASDRVFPDDAGPATISYWPWSQAQVVIIDGVGPFVASNEPGREANVARFKTMLQNELGTVAGVLKRCHTVWVLGDLSPPPPRGQFDTVLNEFAKAVAAYCESSSDPLVVELDLPPARQPNKGAIFGTTRSAAHATTIRSVRRVSKN